MLTTREAFADMLYDKLGLTTLSEGVFSDAGGKAGALFDAGIANGIGDGLFGGANNITRGEAFTLLARAYGLADKSTSVADASKALVDAGIVKGYDGSGNLGLADTLKASDAVHLFNQFDAAGVGEATPNEAVDAGQGERLDTEVMADPNFAAQLRGFGLSEAQIESAFDAQQAAIENRLLDVAAQTSRQTEQFVENNDISHEQRGFFRAGQRLRRAQEGVLDIEDNAARTERGLNDSLLNSQMERDLALAEIGRERAEAEAAARVRLGNAAAQQTIREYEVENL